MTTASFICTIRKINTRPNTKSQGFVKFPNFKNFNDAAFLDDLHSIPWEDIRFKRNVDEMLQLWKTFLVQVLDKHDPIRVKRLRKKGDVPWVNSEVMENY